MMGEEMTIRCALLEGGQLLGVGEIVDLLHGRFLGHLSKKPSILGIIGERKEKVNEKGESGVGEWGGGRGEDLGLHLMLHSREHGRNANETYGNENDVNIININTDTYNH